MPQPAWPDWDWPRCRYRVEAQLQAGLLKVVLAQWPPQARPVNLLWPHSRQPSPRARLFADRVSEPFARAGTA